MDHLYDHQHGNEYRGPSHKCILSGGRCDPEWNCDDAFVSKSTKKKGVFTISGTIQGILFLLVGGFWLIPVALIAGGLICDFLILGRNEITTKSMVTAYTVFNGIFAFGAIVGPMSFLQSAFVGAMEKIILHRNT